MSGTAYMNYEERGLYITLLCHQHQTGRIPEKTIRFLLGSTSVSVWDAIKDKFAIDENGCYYNSFLEEQIIKRLNFNASRVVNGNKGGRPKADKKPKENLMVNQVPNLMPNLNETYSNSNSISNSNSNLISLNSSIEGGMGGDSKVTYPMNYWENLYKEFHDAYGPYGYPWKKWDVIENLRLATKTILHEWEKMSINADYTKAGEFLIECAKLSQESDRNAKRDKRKAPHNWLADQNYMTNPHDVAPKQMTESEKLLEAIKKANANRHTA